MSPQDRGSFHHAKEGSGHPDRARARTGWGGDRATCLSAGCPIAGTGGKDTPGVWPRRTWNFQEGGYSGAGRRPGEKAAGGRRESERQSSQELREETSSSSPSPLSTEGERWERRGASLISSFIVQAQRGPGTGGSARELWVWPRT